MFFTEDVFLFVSPQMNILSNAAREIRNVAFVPGSRIGRRFSPDRVCFVACMEISPLGSVQFRRKIIFRDHFIALRLSLGIASFVIAQVSRDLIIIIFNVCRRIAP